MRILITGSLGLIGSTTADYFLKKGCQVFGIDNDLRKLFFGNLGSNVIQKRHLTKSKKYHHIDIDIRNKRKIYDVFKKNKFDAIIHCAGQPSHDKSSEVPLLDFEVNTLGTLNLLEATRNFSSNAPFVFTSSNKLYGTHVNNLPLLETKTRYSYRDKKFKGIDESFSIDQTLHSLMGASKTAADIYVQEYGNYYGLKTTCLRLGCVTGGSHSGVKLHGFLSFLVKSLVLNNSYEIIGYKGKQVRDQIHAYDVVVAIQEVIRNPHRGEIFNMGGGQRNNASILELINLISKKIKIKPQITYNKNPRKGDHIVYISDYRKFKKYYPDWKITKSLNMIVDELIKYEQKSH